MTSRFGSVSVARGYVVLGAVAGWLGSAATAQELGTVLGEQKIAAAVGGFAGALDANDHFGFAVAALEDLDGDGVAELAVGAPDDDDGGVNRGAVWVLFLRSDGTVRAQAKLSSTQGGLAGPVRNVDRFGSALAALGDLDGDGSQELAVGAPDTDDGGASSGALWLLSLAPDGSALASRKVSAASTDFAGPLRAGDRFGCALARLPDMDGDGVPELAVGASTDLDGGTGRGAVWVLYLDAGSGVKHAAKLSSKSGGGLEGLLDDGDRFGASLASLGDLDRDGTTELAVGADNDGDGGVKRGAVWVLSLATDGSVARSVKHSWLSHLDLHDNDFFGCSVAALGDVDGDRTMDLAVGAMLDDDGGLNRGAVWVLFLEPDGSLKAARTISSTSGGLTGPLAGNGFFGGALAALGDLDGDDKLDLAVGGHGDDTGGVDRGALFVLMLETVEPVHLVVRNGLGVNPMLLSAEAPPVVGETWEALVDCRGKKHGLVVHLAVDTLREDGPFGRLGQRLIAWCRPPLMLAFVKHSGQVTVVRHAVPGDMALVGLPFYSQALVTGSGGARLTNALDGEFVQPSGL
jgi:FG-GAP repeat protein